MIVVGAAVLFFFFFLGALWAFTFQVLPSTVPALSFYPYAAATAMIHAPCAFGVVDHVHEIQSFIASPPATGVSLVGSNATINPYMSVRVLG